jgi:hypothetical protein
MRVDLHCHLDLGAAFHSMNNFLASEGLKVVIGNDIPS